MLCLFSLLGSGLLQGVSASADAGITLNTECMSHGDCHLSVYDTLDIRKDRAPGERTSVMVFLQDIILGATYFIGVVVTIALIVSGFMYVMSSADQSQRNKASEGIKYSLIGLVVVSLSLVIIRLVQYLASVGS